MIISKNLISNSNVVEQTNTYNFDNFSWVSPFNDKEINFTLHASETVTKFSFVAEGYLRDSNGIPESKGWKTTVVLSPEEKERDFQIGRSEFAVVYTISDNVLTVSLKKSIVDDQEIDQVLLYNITLFTNYNTNTSIELKENECFIQNNVLVNGNINNTGIMSTANLVLPPLRMIKVKESSSTHWEYRFTFPEPFSGKNYACYYIEFGDIDSSNTYTTEIAEQGLALEGDIITSKPGRFIIPLRYISLDDSTLT